MQELWWEKIVGGGGDVEGLSVDGVRECRTVWGKVNGARARTEDADGGATHATDMLIGGRDEGRE
jgi:hypothetical protein